ncbi:MAG TPA: hypothetical protein VG476_03720 [Acidimicrobiales bacterium]|nr:hypothetical protein [Acidimicrobiales bacterium]
MEKDHEITRTRRILRRALLGTGAALAAVLASFGSTAMADDSEGDALLLAWWWM